MPFFELNHGYNEKGFGYLGKLEPAGAEGEFVAQATAASNFFGAVPPDLTVLAYVGTSDIPAANGNNSVTGVGFTPKVLMPFTSLSPTDGTHTQTLVTDWIPEWNTKSGHLSFGVATASAQRSVSTSQDGTDRFYGRHYTDLATHTVSSNTGYNGFSADTYNLARASRTSLDADGFTLNWNNLVSLGGVKLNNICLGGTDLAASLTNSFSLNSFTNSHSFAHGLGTTPTTLIFFNLTTFAGFGFWTSTGQTFSGFRLQGTAANDPANSDRIFSNSASYWRNASVTSVTSTTVNITTSGTAYTVTGYCLALAGCKSQVGTFDCAGSLSPLTISCPGINPKLWIGIGSGAAVDNPNVLTADLLYSLGASDGTRTRSCGITDQEVYPINTKRYQSSSSFVEYDVSGVKQFEAGVTFSGQSVVITPTVNNSSSYGQGGYLIIGS